MAVGLCKLRAASNLSLAVRIRDDAGYLVDIPDALYVERRYLPLIDDLPWGPLEPVEPRDDELRPLRSRH
jgi:hypothetical protein